MFKKQTFFKKLPENEKVDSKSDTSSFKFTELSLDDVLDDTVVDIKSNIDCKIQNNNAKDKQKDFAKNLFIKSHQLGGKSVNVSLRNTEVGFIPYRQNILFPVKNQRKPFNNREAGIFSKYIIPSHIVNFIKWIKYSTNRSHLDINELINSAHKPEIKKLIPNMYQLGTDIVPSYLQKRTKKSKIKQGNIKPESKYHSIIKAHKTFGSYFNNELNLTFIGSPKCGKSTIIGNILLYLEVLDSSFIKKTEWEAVKMNSPQCKAAWLTDTSIDERSFKETISMSSHCVDIKERTINLIDSPGNLCYYEQIIKSVVKSDCVLLMINLVNDWSPTTMEYTNVDYLHTVFHLLKVFSIDQLEIIFVNALHDGNIEKPIAKIRSMWKKFSKTEPNHIVIDNLSHIRTSELQLLVERIHNFHCKPSSSELDKPLLLEIIDIYKPVESALPVVVGNVLRGGISSGVNNRSSKAVVLPEKIVCTVKSMKIQEKSELKTRSFAFPGHLVEFSLVEINTEDKIKKGSFICHPDSPLSISNHFKVQMQIFEFTTNNPIINGMKVLLWSKCRSCFCDLTKILSVEYYEGRQKVTKNSPRLVNKPGSTVTALLRTDDLLAVEFRSDHKLDVFLLFSGLRLFAAGKFLDVVLC